MICSSFYSLHFSKAVWWPLLLKYLFYTTSHNQIVQKWSKQEILVRAHYILMYICMYILAHMYVFMYVYRWQAQSLSSGVSRISVAQHARNIKENKLIFLFVKAKQLERMLAAARLTSLTSLYFSRNRTQRFVTGFVLLF